MAGRIDTLMLERQAAQKAVTTLRTDFRAAVRETTKSKASAKKYTVTSKFRDHRLDRITFSAPYYLYMQNYGFEGNKKNGIKMRLKSTDVLNKTLAKSKALETLLDEVTAARGSEVMAKFDFDGKK